MTFRAPINLPPTPAEKINFMRAEAKSLRYKAGAVLDTPVVGPRGQQLTVRSAQERGAAVAQAIDTEESMGSQRHRSVGRTIKLLTLTFVVVVDFPIMLWLASSVFNVNWLDPLGLPLAVSAVVSLLATGGAASALYHLGNDQRQNKDHRGQLDRSRATTASKIVLTGVATLALLVAGVAFLRVYVEGVLSGVGDLALLLASLVAIVMLISTSLLFWIAFRDGSPERDDVVFYTRLVGPHLRRKVSYDDAAALLEDQIEFLSGPSDASTPPPGGVASGAVVEREAEPSQPVAWRVVEGGQSPDTAPPVA